MNFSEFQPIPVLKPYIRSYFHMRVKEGPIHLPSDGCPALLINLGEPFLLDNGEKSLKKLSGCSILGAPTRYLSGRADGPRSFFVVKFLPGKMSFFFKMSGIELTDTSASLESVWGKSGKDLEDQIYGKKSIHEIIQLLETVFLQQLSLEHYADKKIAAVLDYIMKYRGQVRVEELAQWVGLSRRQLERSFLAIVGLTPKRLCRVVRFSSVSQQIVKNIECDWADLALSCGYSDQAHFIRECKFFTNYTPENYIDIRSPFEIAAHGFK